MARFGPIGAVIVNSSAGRILKPWERIHPLSLLALLKTELLNDETECEKEFLSLVSNSPGPKPVAEWAAISRSGKTSFSNALRQVAASARFRLSADPLAKSNILVLGSSKDRLVSSACSPALAQKLCARLEMHPWAGHELTLDDPQWVIEKVQSWLSV